MHNESIDETMQRLQAIVVRETGVGLGAAALAEVQGFLTAGDRLRADWVKTGDAALQASRVRSPCCWRTCAVLQKCLRCNLRQR